MLKVKAFKQRPAQCGPTSLNIVLDFYGVHTTEQEIIRRSRYRAHYQSGSGARGLARAARQYGCKAYVRDSSSLALLRRLVKKERVPVIVNWFDAIVPPPGIPEGHYSVVVDIDKRRITLADSEIGRKRNILLREFLPLWFDFSPHDERSKKALVVRRMIVVARKRSSF